MWQLKPPSEKCIKWYQETMLPGLKKRILKSNKLPDSVKDILLPHRFPYIDCRDEGILVKLLTADPVESIRLNDRLMKEIKSVLEVLLGLPFKDNIFKILEKTFAYDSEISGNKERAYELTHEQGRYTCTYCNRLYTFTVVRNDADHVSFPRFGDNHKNNWIARPHLDHWFDKGTHPLLSLNIFNLVPSCPICNSSVKGSEHFSLSTHIHPYLYDKIEPPFRFVVSPNNKSPRFPYVVKIDELLCDNKERTMIKSLALKEVYSYHGMLEAKDILDWRIANSSEYLHELFVGLSAKYKRTTEDVFRMFFGTEYLPENNLDRPLSKLKRDILIQIGLLDNNGQFIG